MPTPALEDRFTVEIGWNHNTTFRVALSAAEKLLRGPFWPPYANQIHTWGVVCAPFRKV
jgi:hypothetical protein